jgi:hypothetical protein
MEIELSAGTTAGFERTEQRGYNLACSLGLKPNSRLSLKYVVPLAVLLPNDEQNGAIQHR